VQALEALRGKAAEALAALKEGRVEEALLLLVPQE